MHKIHLPKSEIFQNFTHGFLLQQVNCNAAMGKGLALEIKKRFPDVFTDYINACNDNKNKKLHLSNLLGTYVHTNIGNKSVISIFGQVYWAGHILANSDRQTSYDAVDRALNLFAQINKTGVVHCPTIGCSLGGGNWQIMKTIVTTNLKEFEIIFYDEE